ncbi:hypothetical protein LguiB_013053 [Lonicera macranthoides]
MNEIVFQKRIYKRIHQKCEQPIPVYPLNFGLDLSHESNLTGKHTHQPPYQGRTYEMKGSMNTLNGMTMRLPNEW